MIISSALTTNYDRMADTLYVSARRIGKPAVAKEEDEPGIYWRYDSAGDLVGVTILDFEDFWRPKITELVAVLAQRFRIPYDDASRLLKQVH